MPVPEALQALTTIRDFVRWGGSEFNRHGLMFGHGFVDAIDEARYLTLHALSLPHDCPDTLLDAVLTPAERESVFDCLHRRCRERMPAAYITRESWFCGLRFYVDQRVLVPRSPLAELIMAGFEPWADPAGIRSVLEIGTGSGCIAIVCALAFPDARVTATDISPDALAVATLNVARHGVGDRLELVETDLSEGLQGPFDVIITNPPYVPDSEQADLPAEYGHEPALGLYSGADGLDSARRILQDAPALLAQDGILVLEVGAQWADLEAAFPGLPMTWLDFEHGGAGVAVFKAADLRQAFLV